MNGFRMKSVSATEAKNNFGELLLGAQASPISITRNGKEQGVLMSANDYALLKKKAMQAAVNEGISSGSAGELDIEYIKQSGRELLGK